MTDLFSMTRLAVNVAVCNKAIIQDPTTPKTRRYTTL